MIRTGIQNPGGSDSDMALIMKKAFSTTQKGCFYGNCVEGTGVFVYEDGDVYGGSFRNAKRYGRGEIIYKNGSKFTGFFVNDLKNGNGKYEFSNGDIYEGNFNDGRPEGEGIYYFTDGRTFQGEFSSGGSSASGTLKRGTDEKDCSIDEYTVGCKN
ncbi:MAG: hypothetical protein OEZ34_06820 [Spirochaetia bacterium]|nr:hypothetical protein [Spirochaetia bacterium]